jgi:predicted GIY-YIG superfamily endonuclease
MIVYMLINKNTNDFYVGSTIDLYNRIHYYHEEYDNNGKRKVIKKIRETGGFKDWSFVVIEKIETGDRESLIKAEFTKIKSLEPNLNVVRNSKYLGKDRMIYLDI